MVLRGSFAVKVENVPAELLTNTALQPMYGPPTGLAPQPAAATSSWGFGFGSRSQPAGTPGAVPGTTQSAPGVPGASNSAGANPRSSASAQQYGGLYAPPGGQFRQAFEIVSRALEQAHFSDPGAGTTSSTTPRPSATTMRLTATLSKSTTSTLAYVLVLPALSQILSHPYVETNYVETGATSSHKSHKRVWLPYKVTDAYYRNGAFLMAVRPAVKYNLKKIELAARESRLSGAGVAGGLSGGLGFAEAEGRGVASGSGAAAAGRRGDDRRSPDGGDGGGSAVSEKTAKERESAKEAVFLNEDSEHTSTSLIVITADARASSSSGAAVAGSSSSSGHHQRGYTEYYDVITLDQVRVGDHKRADESSF